MNMITLYIHFVILNNINNNSHGAKCKVKIRVRLETYLKYISNDSSTFAESSIGPNSTNLYSNEFGL